MAQFISVVFHPLLMPSYLFLFIIRYAASLMRPLRMESLLEIWGIIFLVSFVIPSISIGALRLTRYITDLSLRERSQRLTPFFFTACFYGLTAYMFYPKLSVNNLVFLIFAAITALIIIILIITLFWKISIHGAAIGGVIGFVLAIGMAHPIAHLHIILACLVLVAGLVMYARIASNAHTPFQVYAGALLGLVTCLLAIIKFF